MTARHLAQQPTAVYRFFDEADALLYVGISAHPERRFSAHRRTPWWPLVNRGTIDWEPDRIAAHEHEQQAIASESPQFNKATGHVPLAIIKPLPPVSGDGDVGPFAGAEEIARLLGVSRQRVQQLVGKPDFPAPIERLAMGSVWLVSDVEAWMARSGRTPARAMRIDDATWEAVKAEAERRGETATDVVRRALNEHLRRIERRRK